MEPMIWVFLAVAGILNASTRLVRLSDLTTTSYGAIHCAPNATITSTATMMSPMIVSRFIYETRMRGSSQR